MELLIGLILSLLIGFIAYKKHSLTMLGFLTATTVGTAIFYYGTYIIYTLLMVFFILSTIVTKIGQSIAEKKKGRNARQVLSNSIVTLIFSVLYHYTKIEGFLLVAAISIAVSNADTWASEIGKLSKGRVLSILNFKPLKKGESGGVSLLGTAASLLGGLVIAMAFYVLYNFEYGFNNQNIIKALIIAGAAFIGSIIDSYLGVLIQAKYMEIETSKQVETIEYKNEHYRLVSGIYFVNNDLVNLLTSMVIASLFAFILI